MPGERKRSAARKEEVLDIALRIIDEKGIHALTLREISDRIGISEAALFRHFRDKGEIMSSLADRVFTHFILEEEALSGTGLNERLISLMERQFSAFQGMPEATAVLFQEEIFREYPQVKEGFDARRRERAIKIASLVADVKRKGEVAQDVNEDTFALIYMGAMRMAVLEWRSSRFSYDLAARAGPICRELLKILSSGAPSLKGSKKVK